MFYSPARALMITNTSYKEQICLLIITIFTCRSSDVKKMFWYNWKIYQNIIRSSDGASTEVKWTMKESAASNMHNTFYEEVLFELLNAPAQQNRTSDTVSQALQLHQYKIMCNGYNQTSISCFGKLIKCVIMDIPKVPSYVSIAKPI